LEALQECDAEVAQPPEPAQEFSPPAPWPLQAFNPRQTCFSAVSSMGGFAAGGASLVAGVSSAGLSAGPQLEKNHAADDTAQSGHRKLVKITSI
jgi:hypothetical protein